MGVTTANGFPSFAKTLRAFDRAKSQTIRGAVQRVLTRVRTEAVAKIRTTGIGRALIGKTVGSFVKQTAAKAVGEAFEANIDVTGLPGLLERGGRTASHDIKATGKVLALKSAAGTIFVRGAKGQAPVIRHPGGPVAVKPTVREALEAAEPLFRAEIAAAMGEAMAEAQANG